METPSRIAFAAGLIGLALLTFIYGDFALQWQPVPAWVPDRRVLASASGAPFVEGNWLGLGEISMVLACSWALFALLNDRSNGSSPRFATGANGLRIARYLFALALLPVGLSHFMYAPQTVALVPAWLPYRLGGAYLGGAGHIAAGLAVLFGVLPHLAATLEAAMIGMFTLLVWAPGVVAAPGNRLQWTAFTISYTIAAAAWVVAASLSRASSPSPVESLHLMRSSPPAEPRHGATASSDA